MQFFAHIWHCYMFCVAIREYLFRGYGGGPVIGFYIPVGMSESELKGKLWLEHIVITQVPIVVSDCDISTCLLYLFR